MRQPLTVLDGFRNRDGNEQVCEADGAAGCWYVAVRNDGDFSGVSLNTPAGGEGGSDRVRG